MVWSCDRCWLSRSDAPATEGFTTLRATVRRDHLSGRSTVRSTRSQRTPRPRPNYAVGNVSGTGANAAISRYPWSVPGTHVDGVSAWLYPIVPSQVTG